MFYAVSYCDIISRVAGGVQCTYLKEKERLRNKSVKVFHLKRNKVNKKLDKYAHFNFNYIEIDYICVPSSIISVSW